MFSVSVRYLFYQPMDEKIKTWTLRFPAKKYANMEKALFDWPIVLQCDAIAKYRLVSRKFSVMKFFHPSVRLTNQKPRVCIRSTNQSCRSIPYFVVVVVSVSFARFHFKVIRKFALLENEYHFLLGKYLSPLMAPGSRQVTLHSVQAIMETFRF